VVAYTSDAVGTFAVHSYTLVISPAAAPAPAGCPTSPTGWRGEYYANGTLSGSPALCRDDASIAFTWNGAAPGAGVPGTDFSVRWSRTVNLTAGSYEFAMGSDDGARLYIDGAIVMDDWVLRSHSSRVITQLLGTGPHNIVMEYFQGPGLADASLTWAPVVAATCPNTATGWLGEYFRNRSLTGPATLCRDDAAINFDWAQGTPGAPIPTDDFSVRWTRTQTFAAGNYAFQIGSDDGARLYVDGVLVGDWWYDTSYVTRTVNRTLSAGSHTIVMEFYERGGEAHATLTW
ncbi:MAG: hypothetical protein JWN99_1713, partial [Ilumatobacteraceae bacterium]|nr:hypothetical protein [Ilumatobacteraceae bacterium]